MTEDRKLYIKSMADYYSANNKLNPRDYLIQKGIPVISASYKDGTDALTLVNNKGNYIVVENTNVKLESRKLFSLAHEIGHLVLHDDIKNYHVTYYKNNKIFYVNNSELEREANYFASQFMAPDKQLLIMALRTRYNITDTDIMQKFNMSREAANIRLSNFKQDLKYDKF